MDRLTPRLQLFATAEIDTIVQQAIAVLEGVGVLVEHAEGRNLLLEHGAQLRGDRLRLSEGMVRRALDTVPGEITLYDRLGEPAMVLGQGRTHFDPGSAALHLLDPVTQRRREVSTADAVALARLVDGLPCYHAQSTAIAPADVPRDVCDRYRLYLALRHATKPVVTGTFVRDGFAPMVAMLAALRGGAEALRAKPLAIFDCCPSPPLIWSDLTCDALLGCARAGIPAQLISMPLAGATAPVTLRECVVQHCAECLSGIALHQLAQPGSPILYGGCPSSFDMRSGTTPIGAMQTAMIDVGYAQVGKHLGLPVQAYMALSDAKVPDYQAGMESGIGAVLAALAGIDLVSGPGILDFILTQSMEKLLLDHEACAQALRLQAGFTTHETDILGLFGALVDKGSLLAHPHTRQHWRAELGVASPVLDRGSYGDWELAGGQWAHERAAEQVTKRLAKDRKPELEPGLASELDGLMLAELRRHGLGTLPRF
jgi:trimethylamine--corrinoid protein Co-methyltransferase